MPAGRTIASRPLHFKEFVSFRPFCARGPDQSGLSRAPFDSAHYSIRLIFKIECRTNRQDRCPHRASPQSAFRTVHECDVGDASDTMGGNAKHDDRFRDGRFEGEYLRSSGAATGCGWRCSCGVLALVQIGDRKFGGGLVRDAGSTLDANRSTWPLRRTGLASRPLATPYCHHRIAATVIQAGFACTNPHLCGILAPEGNPRRSTGLAKQKLRAGIAGTKG
jgi:hypothetical protein